MYASDILVSKNLKDYASVLTDIKENAFTPVLLFTRPKRLAYLKTELMAIGNIKGNYNANSLHADKKVMLGLEIQSTETVDISLPDDTKTPWITGFAFMSAENVILCDHQNDNINMRDSSWTVKQRLKLSQYPYDVTVVDDSNVVVTLPGAESLQFIEVFPDMKPYRIVSLDKGCYGIDVYSQEIYTACHNQPEEGEILILDLNGTIKRKIGVNQDGSFLFESPYYISISTQGNIFVSDLDTDIITCLTTEGCIIRQYENDDLKNPVGMYVDARENIFVCSKKTGNVKVITFDGRKYESLLSSKDALKFPHAISFRGIDNILLVSCSDTRSNKLFIFKLA